MKTNLLAIAILCFTQFFLNSCNKNDFDWKSAQELSGNNVDIIINQYLHNIYDSELNQNYKKGIKNIRLSLDLDNVKKIRNQESNHESLYSVPLKKTFLSNNETLFDNVKIVLFKITKDNKVVDAKIVELVSNKSSSSELELYSDAIKIYSLNKNRFSGSINISSINNEFVSEDIYSDGKLIKSKYLVQKRKISTTTSYSYSKMVCIDWYWETYIGNILVSSVYVFTSCAGNDCEQTRVNTENGYVTVRCGGGGSNSSSPSANSVRNKVLDSCIKNLINSITANTNMQNAITNILVNTFAVSSRVNLSFVQNDNLVNDYGQPINGHASATYNNQANTINVTVEINANKLKNSSQQYKSAVIIHEIIHGVLHTDTTTYNGMTQHAYILANYIDGMSTALMDYFPTLPLQEARSISLDGLGTTVYNSQAFLTVISNYGFNSNSNSSDSYFYYRVLHEAGSLGLICN